MLRADFVFAGKAGEIGQLTDGEVDLHAGAGVVDPPHGVEKRCRQFMRFEQFVKRQVRVDVRGDAGGRESAAVF